ncbi:hypothetical protein [Pedobacter sp. NJ-S-72]
MLYILFEKGFKYFRPQKRIVAVTLILLFVCLHSTAQSAAQEKIHLPAAIDSALKNK